MVKNAVRIINLTVFKINDPKLNQNILSDVPYCLSFVHTACLLRDKVCNGIDKSYSCQNYIRTINENTRASNSGNYNGEQVHPVGSNLAPSPGQQPDIGSFARSSSALSHSPISSTNSTGHAAPGDAGQGSSGSETQNSNNMLLDFFQALTPDQSHSGA